MYGEAKPLLEEALAIRRRIYPESSPEVWQSELDVGRLEVEQWTDRSSGEVRSKTLVTMDRLELCGSRGGGVPSSSPGSAASPARRVSTLPGSTKAS